MRWDLRCFLASVPASSSGMLYDESDNRKGRLKLKNRKAGMESPSFISISHTLASLYLPSFLREEDAILGVDVLAMFDAKTAS